MLLTDMKTLLTSISTVINIGEMGEASDNLLCIYFSGGSNPSHGFGARLFEQPSFQVRIRHTIAATATSWAEQVKDALDGQSNLTIGSVRYISIFQTGDIMPLGKDAKGRTELTVNFQTKIQR